MILALSFALVAQSPDYRQAAAELTKSIETRFWRADQNEYAEELTLAGQPAKFPAFTWDKAVYLSAAALGCQVDAKTYRPVFDKISASLTPYGSVVEGVFGYSDLPVKGKTDRYYDDNEWIVLAQIEAYEATHGAKYLEDAKKLFEFVMSGESKDLGGGIFWRENERKSKNTCSNAPAIVAAAKLYLLTKNDRFLQIALRTYSWVLQLRDTDGLMFDNINLAGKVDRTKWTYNSALMIEAGVMLYKATGKAGFLDDAKKTAASGISHWVDPATGAIKDEAPFAHHLADSFFILARSDPKGPWDATARRAVDYAYRHAQKDGLFGLRWDSFVVRNDKAALLYQASMDRALIAAAISMKRR